MAFIGNTNTTQAFTPAIDYFSGNGSTTAFTLSRPVASVAQVQVTIDNVAQNPSSAYTVSANTITFTSAPLSGTNNIYVYYTSPITQVIAPGQGTVNIAAFNATGTPSSSTYLRGDNTWATVVTALTTSSGLSTNTSATGAVSVTNTGVTSLTTSSGLSTNTSATGAVSVTNTGVTSIVAGTNITISGSTGDVTVNAAGGGVTSLNGQTGAVVTTTLGNIGSIIQAAVNTGSNQVAGDTIAGSSIYYATSITTADGGPSYRQYTEGSLSTFPRTIVNQQAFSIYYLKTNSGNTGYTVPGGAVSTLSGTWRILTPNRARISSYDSCNNRTDSLTFIFLMVRVS